MKNTILVFDFDGTIADTFYHNFEIVNRLSQEFAFRSVNHNEIDALKDKDSHEIIAHLKVPFYQIPAIVARVRKELQKDMDSVQVIRGLPETIRQLRSQGYPTGILSSNSAQNVRRFLANHNLDLFDFISASSKIWGKTMRLKNLIKRKKLPKKNIIYIGDEIRDIEAAQKAGVKIAAVTWGYNSRTALAKHKPTYLIKDPCELLSVLSVY